MPKFTAADAQCFIFTFKEGLLSKIAHDLKLQVNQWQVEVTADPLAVEATFALNSLTVVDAMHDGQQTPGALSESDKAKIAKQIGSEVLHCSQHPEARFVSTGITPAENGCLQIEGELTLHGVTQSVATKTTVVDGMHEATISLHQPDFGITPFKAMMGTLKVQADVKVQIRIPQ